MKRPPFAPIPAATIAKAKRLYESGESPAAIAAALEIAATTVTRRALKEGWAAPARGAASERSATPAETAKKSAARKPARTTAAKAAARKTPSGQAPTRKPPTRKPPTRKPPTKKAPAQKTATKKAAPSSPSRGASAAAKKDEPSFGADRRAALIDRLWRVAEKQVAEIERRLSDADEAAGGERDARALAVLTRMLRELASFGAGAAEANIVAEDEDEFDRDADEYGAKIAGLLEALRGGGDEPAGARAGDAAAAREEAGDGLAVPGAR